MFIYDLNKNLSTVKTDLSKSYNIHGKTKEANQIGMTDFSLLVKAKLKFGAPI